MAMELTFIKERQLAGIEAAKRKGIYKGLPKMVDEAEIHTRMASGSTKAQVARDMGVSRMTIYRALQKQPSTENRSA